MTLDDGAHDKELLERYRRASDMEPAVPSEAVRTAILAEGRRVAEQRAKATSQQPFDVSRRAANDSRWKITVFGTAGAALVAALLFAPHLWDNGSRPALQSSNAPQTSKAPAGRVVSPEPQSSVSQAQSSDQLTAPATAGNAAPKAQSRGPVQPNRQGSLAEMAPAETARGEQPVEKKYARNAADIARSTADSTPSARTAPAAAAGVGYDQSDVSASRLGSARAKLGAGPSGLLSAAASGDTLKIQALMDQGAPVNERDPQGRTPLMLAVIDGRREAVRLLLDQGADPNAADNSGRTPLQLARQANSREIATLLEQSGARPR